MMEIFKGTSKKDMLFLDIETVRLANDYESLSDEFKDSFQYKIRYAREAVEKFGIEDIENLWQEKSPLWSEFSKIVCISLGYITDNETLRIKSYSSHDEKELLTMFIDDITLFYNNNSKIKIVGHAVTGFDIPAIMRRCIVNQVPLHPLIDVSNKKPWEVQVIDTLTAWKASGYYSASLLNIATVLGIPSPKSDIDGSQVSDVYWIDNDLDRITRYCERDVFCTVNIVRRLMYEPLIELDASSNTDIEVEKIAILSNVYSAQAITIEQAEEISEILNDLGYNEEQKKKVITIVKSAVKGGKISKEILTKLCEFNIINPKH